MSRPDDGSDLLQLLELAAKTIPQQLNAGNHTYMQILSKYCRRLGCAPHDACASTPLLLQSGLSDGSCTVARYITIFNVPTGARTRPLRGATSTC